MAGKLLGEVHAHAGDLDEEGIEGYDVTEGKGGKGKAIGNFRFQNTLDNGKGLARRDIG